MMAKELVKINGVRIYRRSIVKFYREGNNVAVVDCLGETETICFEGDDAEARAAKALAMLDNLTEIDDIDGL